MQCMIPNTCADRSLCCNFCANMQCSVRCKDDSKKCKYFDNAGYEKPAAKDSEQAIGEEKRWITSWKQKGKTKAAATGFNQSSI